MGNLMPTAMVEPATRADIPAITVLQTEAFNSEYMKTVFPNSLKGMAHLGGSWTRFVDPEYNFSGQPKPKTMIVRDEQGAVVSVALYYIVRPGEPYGPGSFEKRWLPSSFDPDSAKEKIGFFDPMAKNHVHVMEQREHLFLEVLMTSDTERKKGFGTALLKWGAVLADKMGVEVYLDAAPGAKRLYEANGYVEQGVPGAGGAVALGAPIPMMRPRKSG